VESSRESGNEPLGSIKFHKTVSGYTTDDLLSSTHLHLVG
jgi:hypothetical protein